MASFVEISFGRIFVTSWRGPLGFAINVIAVILSDVAFSIEDFDLGFEVIDSVIDLVDDHFD
jgi:hypothetical protein